MKNKHAILIIKNNNNEYLQIFEETWNSYLFLNCKINNKEDKNSILKYMKEISSEEPISIEYKMDKIHTKFSCKDKIDKEYHHYFFVVNIELENKNKEFILNEHHFKWYSYNELLKDKTIQQVNSDIVHFIKEI